MFKTSEMKWRRKQDFAKTRMTNLGWNTTVLQKDCFLLETLVFSESFCQNFYQHFCPKGLLCRSPEKFVCQCVCLSCPVCVSEVRFGHDFERFTAGKRRFRGPKRVKKLLFLGFWPLLDPNLERFRAGKRRFRGSKWVKKWKSRALRATLALRV